jgi:hypothetical protein
MRRMGMTYEQGQAHGLYDIVKTRTGRADEVLASSVRYVPAATIVDALNAYDDTRA